MAQEKQEKVSFKSTLNLPRTDFPIRSNPKVDDPAMITRWEKENIFEKTSQKSGQSRTFILHDGPPYANGHIHLGHAYNKVLKDILTKSQRMFGAYVPVKPGWDCHGLPIELKVSQMHPGLAPEDLKKECRKYAQGWIDTQREEFKNLGVIMDWDNPYTTMSFDFEASILRSFAEFVEKGYIERSNKTVPWCPSCKTVLASAEIEYAERKDPSIYVLFTLDQVATDELVPELKGKPVSLVAWTTTPWTIPLNRAVVLKPDTMYVVLAVKDKYVVVGKELAQSICKTFEVEQKVVGEFMSDELARLQAHVAHPLVDGQRNPVLLDQSVLTEDGTACVHNAPGAGPEDYEIGIKNKLEIYSPVGPDGKFTAEIKPDELEGKHISEAQGWVIKTLMEREKLLHKSSIRHSYPHCWRCRGGLIFRATKQWFCNLEKHNLKERALKATEAIQTVPEKSINRLQATLEGRLEWCLSRQRVWGAPIPALHCARCEATFISKEFVERVADGVEEEGIEFWDTVQLKDLGMEDFACQECGSHDFFKEKDILDVWFESGVSHAAVLQNSETQQFPADVYLEGKDQHRAWFQSSLLTSMVLYDQAAMKALITHGFTVDEKGRKMSKSLGNTVAPQELIEKLGTDGLRLWVSSIDCSSEAVVSDTLLKNVQEVFRKIRNTCRFLLSNLYDFDIDTDEVALAKLRIIDRYALQDLFEFQHNVLQAYTDYDFTAVFHKLGDYCAVNLSSFYLDIVKDRLYVERADGFERRSAQTACWYILDTLTRLMAPILSFTAEQVSDLYQKEKKESIHLQQFAPLISVWEALAKEVTELAPGMDVPELRIGAFEAMQAVERFAFVAAHEHRWDMLKSMRSAILKAIEELREKGDIRHSLEADVTLFIESQAAYFSTWQQFIPDVEKQGQSIEQFFKEFLIVSNIQFAQDAQNLEKSTVPGLYISVSKASGVKCPRCWMWASSEHEQGLCPRCAAIVS